MTILHICSLDLDKASGVTVIVPQYALEQSQLEKVVMLNLNKTGFDTKDFQVYKGKECLDEILEKEQIDIAVFHGIYYLAYASVSKRLKKERIPYIIVPHGSLRAEAQSQKKIAKMVSNAIFFNRFIKSASAIQYLSSTEKMASSKFKNNYFISPNGVYMSMQRWEKKERETFKLVFIGRYALYYKGLDILLDACKLIKEQMEKKKIVIELFGTDFENNKSQLLNLQTQYGLENIVHINGPVYDEDKRAVMLDADAFIQTSRSEGQPVGVLEAMAIGLVPIVTRGTTFMELVEEKNCGFPAGETKEDVAKAILNAYESREQLSQMSQNALKLIEEQYEWSKVTKNLISQYEKIVKDCN